MIGKTVHRKTWFGLDVRITVDSDFVHRVGFGKVELPHPAVINWLLRAGVEEEKSHDLVYKHELGHFQTIPLVVVYAAAVGFIVWNTGVSGIVQVFLSFLGFLAFWEVTSELYAVLCDLPAYGRAYDGVSVVPRLVFWSAMLILSALGLFFSIAWLWLRG